MDKKYIETAIILARMYGIAEMLRSFEYLENEKFVRKIEKWAGEFLNMENGDILQFFESQVIE